MARDNALENSLRSLGYSRIEIHAREWGNFRHPSIYRTTGETEEVEHFLYLGGGIKRQQYLAADFGFRSPLVEDFSIESILKYDHPNVRLWHERRDRRLGCVLGYDLGRFHFAEKRIPPSVRVGSKEAAQYVTTTVNDLLLPIVRSASSLLGLFKLLASDAEPCRWFCTSGVARPSQVVALGQVLDISREAICGLLAPHHELYSRHVPDPEIRSSVEHFVDRLIEDWKQRNN